MMRIPLNTMKPRTLETDSSQTSDSCIHSGIMVLTFSRDPIYVSPHASLFLQKLQAFSQSPARSIRDLPPDVVQLCESLESRLLHCPAQEDWNQTPVERTVDLNEFRIQLRAFGLPAQHKLHGSQILILFDRLNLPSVPGISPTSPTILLTERQRTIITGVVRGLTNKELANELGISIHTVKEYLRQIMLRLNTTSRTGIVSRMAGFDSTLKQPRQSFRTLERPGASRHPKIA